jgi:FKBP-type peptidyl-prolyl cis-trans isomerase
MAINLIEDGGITKEIIKQGEGELSPPNGCQVTVHYTGTLTNGTKFDSSKDRNEPFQFKLGVGQVIKGWDVGVASMKRNEVCILTIKPEYGYGSRATGSIPANSTLVFEVELIDWEDEQDISDKRNKSIVQKTFKSGNGSKPQEGDTVKVSYQARSIIFYPNSSKEGEVETEIDAGEIEFVVGDEHVLEAFEIAVTNTEQQGQSRFRIKVGDEKLQVPNDTQYLKHSAKFLEGVKNLGTDKKRVLELVIDVLDIQESLMRKNVDLNTALEMAKTAKEEGNKFFGQSRFKLAKKRYNQVIEMCEELGEFGEEKVEHIKNNLQLPSYLNLAAVALKEKAWGNAIENCNSALEIDSKNVKALYRRAQAHQGQKELEKARDDLTRAVMAEPTNTASQTLLAKIKTEIATAKEKEKKMYSRMFQ